MAHIMIIGTNMMNIYNHRLELIHALLDLKHEVSVVCPAGGEEENLIKLGVRFIDTPVDNRGTSPKNDFRLLLRLIKIFKEERPDIVLTFYTKTNIYGGIACRITSTPYIENITGIGSMGTSRGLLSKFVFMLYKYAIKDADMVFFQNTQNQNFFNDRNIKLKGQKLLPGSGVSLSRFKLLPYPSSLPIKFAFISRVLREKGIDEYLAMAKCIKREYPDTIFYVIGPYSSEYEDILLSAAKDGIIEVVGKTMDVIKFLKETHCTIFPSFYGEGMANVLLESAASGRPVITTDVPGCGEAVDDCVTGFVVRPQDSEDLIRIVKRFIELPNEDRKVLGINGRKKMESEFDRNIVVEAYLNEINKILKQ